MSTYYYSPEEVGLEVVGQVEWSEPCYSFDLSVVWYHPEQDIFYFGSDSGCSCPSPFEDFSSLDDLESGNQHAAIRYLLERKAEEEAGYKNYDNDPQFECYGAAQVVELIGKITSAEYRHVIQEMEY